MLKFVQDKTLFILPWVTISFGSIFRFSRGEGFLLGSWSSRNGVLAFIMGGRRSLSVEVLIELVTRIECEKEPRRDFF